MIGQKLGHYEVVAKLGEGGMGQVYRARDHKLNRDVALKIISPLVADDADRLARFRREAQVLASLNHPNIAQIYGFEDSGPTHALVLELVEGPTLADRIATGPIPVPDTVAIARQIADALAVAHERGIVHRDLKPANIKINGDTVKILDFGLAKALTDPGSQNPGSKDPGLHPSLANSPTLTARGTEIGLILGTAAYMSPEQARGKSVDRRADVWAFGVVLYEMLTGRRAFEGPEVSDVLASVLKDTPPLDALPSDTPASVRRLLRRTLQKDPARRLDSMSAARLELDDDDAAPVVVRDAGAPSRRLAIPVAAAVLLTAIATGAAVWYARQPPPPVVVRLALTPAPDQPIAIEVNHADIAITPDGRRIVYFTEATTSVAQDLRNRGFIVRALDQPDGRPIGKLPANARGLFTSADGRWIGFQAGQSGGRENEIRKVPIDGGASVPICGIDYNMRGASWGPDQTIVFGTSQTGVGLLRVPAAGGKPEVLTTPNGNDGEADHLWPHHLPDGQHVLFGILRSDSSWDVALLSLRTKTWRVLVKGGLSPRYVSAGYLLYATATGIHAVPFDLDRLEVRGDPIEVQPGVLTKESGAADFAVSSATGTLVYLPGESYATTETLAWRETDGRETPVRLSPQPYVGLRVSPDGRLAVAIVGRTSAQSLVLIDLERETSIRLVSDLDINAPLWHPNSREIVFASAGRLATKEAGGLFRLAVTGTSVPERLTTAQAEVRQTPGSFTPDGKQLLFTDGTLGVNADIKLLTYASPPEMTMLMSGPAIEHSPVLSPDGRWLAYVLVENMPQVFVRPFPNVNDTRIPVSNGFGQAPVWSRDSRQLFFQQQGNTEVMMVRVERPSPVVFGKPELFMRLRDGQSELFNVALPPVNGRVLKTVRQSGRPAVSTEYRVVLNWAQELKTRVATR